MRSKYPIPRSPRNLVSPLQGLPLWRSRLKAQVSRLPLLAVVALGTMVGNLLVQGPDAVRRAPEIPSAAFATVTKLVLDHKVDKGLSGIWEYSPQDVTAKTAAIRIVLSSQSDSTSGEMYSEAIRGLSGYNFGMLRGTRTRDTLKLDLYDYLDGKPKVFAVLEIKFTSMYEDSITESPPETVDTTLEVKVVEQVKEALPTSFILKKLP